MRICMMSLMMGKTPVEEIVSTAVECNMEAIDWIGLHGKKACELKKLCDDAGLPIAAHTMFKWAFAKDEKNYFDEFKYSLDDACVMGAKVMMLPPFAREAQTSMEDDRKRYIEYLSRAYELSSKTPVQLTIESTGYRNSPFITADECLEALNAIPGLKITYDPGNVATAEDPLAAFEKLRKYTVHFHIKDWYIRDEAFGNAALKRCGKYFDNAIVGEGDLDLRGFWQMTTAEERELFVNPETCDYSGKLSAVDFFKHISALMKSWEN